MSRRGGQMAAERREGTAGTAPRIIRPVTEPSPHRPSPSDCAPSGPDAAELAALTDARSCVVVVYAVLGGAATAFLAVLGWRELGPVGAAAGALVALVLTWLAVMI